MEDVGRDLLTALANASGTSSDELLRQVSAEPRTGVIYSLGTIEAALFDLERHGLLEQDETDAAEFHAADRPAPIAKRYWTITERGEEALHCEG